MLNNVGFSIIKFCIVVVFIFQKSIIATEIALSDDAQFARCCA